MRQIQQQLYWPQRPPLALHPLLAPPLRRSLLRRPRLRRPARQQAQVALPLLMPPVPLPSYEMHHQLGHGQEQATLPLPAQVPVSVPVSSPECVLQVPQLQEAMAVHEARVRRGEAAWAVHVPAPVLGQTGKPRQQQLAAHLHWNVRLVPQERVLQQAARQHHRHR